MPLSPKLNLLLLSSSRVGDTDYLEHAIPIIQHFTASLSGATNKILFIPYAGVTISYDEYFIMVKQALGDVAEQMTSIHHHENAKSAVTEASMILVGGGNTFQLLSQLYQNDLIDTLKLTVTNGVPYVGWSAGSNIAGSTIKTTNDMPIVQPKSFQGLGFLSIQLNPHYIDNHPPGFHGETREQRLQEFMALDKTPIVGLEEGSGIQIVAGQTTKVGETDLFWFDSNRKQRLDDMALLTSYLSQA
jgi:dipeptidase E